MTPARACSRVFSSLTQCKVEIRAESFLVHHRPRSSFEICATMATPLLQCHEPFLAESDYPPSGGGSSVRLDQSDSSLTSLSRHRRPDMYAVWCWELDIVMLPSVSGHGLDLLPRFSRKGSRREQTGHRDAHARSVCSDYVCIPPRRTKPSRLFERRPSRITHLHRRGLHHPTRIRSEPVSQRHHTQRPPHRCVMRLHRSSTRIWSIGMRILE